MTAKLKILNGFAGLLCLRLAAGASEIPPLVVPEGAGVNIHFERGHEQDLDMIVAAGFKFVRMDFFWSETERQKEVYDWSAFDELTANLEQRGLRAYYILDYSNPLYEDMVLAANATPTDGRKVLASPRHPESVEAFARWAAAAARHFHGHHIIWEIWNEPNGSFWEPAADVKDYTALALATAKSVRTADPGATIVAPATSGFPWPFLESFLKSGVLKYLDGVSVHPYRSPTQPPETAAEDYRKLRDLIATNMPAGRNDPIPVISGEWGYSTHVHGVSGPTQAAFLVRQQLFNLWQGVPISIWYDWKNDGNDPKENEHNFGTVKSDLAPKPAYLAMKTMTRELAGYAIQKRFASGNADFVLVFTNTAGEARLAAWTLGLPHLASLPLAPDHPNEIPAVDGEGRTSNLKTEAGRFLLPLTTSPHYVHLGLARLAD